MPFRSTLALLPAVAVLLVQAAAPALAQDLVVKPQPIQDRKAVFATVEAVDEVRARARIGGTVGKLSVDEGSEVSAGQTIAVVGDTKLLLQGQAAEQRTRAAEAERDLARVEFDRAQDLVKTGAATRSRLDTARARLETAERQLGALRQERQVVAQTSAEGAVQAPANGRVLKVHVTEGSVVMPGEVVASIAGGRTILRLQVPERHARFMREGDAVLVGPRGSADLARAEPRGQVVKVYPLIENGRVSADVTVNDLDGYFVGERVRVFVLAGERNSFLVPDSYLTRRFGLTYARLKDGREVVVQTGQATPDGVEVLSGLQDGDVLVRPEAAR